MKRSISSLQVDKEVSLPQPETSNKTSFTVTISLKTLKVKLALTEKSQAEQKTNVQKMARNSKIQVSFRLF